MDAAFWNQRWATREIGWHEPVVNPLLSAHFARLRVGSGSRVFVPLCGKTLDIHWLLKQGCRVAGVELSETAVRELFAELGAVPVVTSKGPLTRYSAEGLDVFVGDIFDLTAVQLGTVDAIYDRAALVALPPAMRTRYAGQLLALTASAPQLLICFEYDQNVMPGPPHAVPAAEVWLHYGASHEVNLVDVRAVPGGLKGLAPANELVWLLHRK